MEGGARTGNDGPLLGLETSAEETVVLLLQYRVVIVVHPKT